MTLMLCSSLRSSSSVSWVCQPLLSSTLLVNSYSDRKRFAAQGNLPIGRGLVEKRDFATFRRLICRQSECGHESLSFRWRCASGA